MSNDLPNVLYEYLGRVVVKATELERALTELHTTLTLGPPPTRGDGATDEDERLAFVKTWASKPGIMLVVEMLKPDAGVPDRYRQEFEEYLGEVTTALDSRHGVDSSVWLQVEDAAWDTRYPSKNSNARHVRSDVAHFSEAEATLMGQMANLTRLVHWGYIWHGRFEAEWHSGRLPARPQTDYEAIP